MNQWVLLEHKVYSSKAIDMHYDFLVLLLLWEDGKSPLFQLIYFKIRHYFLNLEPLSKELCDLYRMKTYKSLFTFYLSTLFCKKVLLSYY